MHVSFLVFSSFLILNAQVQKRRTTLFCLLGYEVLPLLTRFHLSLSKFWNAAKRKIAENMETARQIHIFESKCFIPIIEKPAWLKTRKILWRSIFSVFDFPFCGIFSLRDD